MNYLVEIINKNTKNKNAMQKNNHLILGFDSLSDFFNTLLGLKNYMINTTVTCIAVLTTFITSYIWDSSSAVYFMLFLVGIDAITGIAKAIKKKIFSSSRLPRILVIMLSYCIMLAISWNAARYSFMFKPLPPIVYGGLISTLIISIFENFAILGIIEKELFFSIKNKVTEVFKNFITTKNNIKTKTKK